MSEGPEVKRRAQELNEALAGKKILAIEAHHRALKEFLERSPEKIIGRPITRVYSLGKHILFELDNGMYLHNHLLMFGSWRIYDAHARVEPDPRIMEIVRNETKQAILRGGSVFEPLDAVQLKKHRSLSKLGPDVLAAKFDERVALRNLRGHLDEEIGVALIDQEIMAGVGNYLKSEILFATRTNPRKRIRELSDRKLKQVIQAAREITRASYENQGYTIPATVQARATEEKGWSRRYWVFRRTNQPCRDCGALIRQFRQGKGEGRITYVCPSCQGMKDET